MTHDRLSQSWSRPLLMACCLSLCAPVHAEALNLVEHTAASTDAASAPLASLAAYLPAESQAKDALLDSPLMQQARAKKQATGLRAQAIESGNAEFTLRALQQQRRIMASDEHYGESSVSLERPLRLWGKRDIDARLAQQTQALAEIEYADALHEGSRELLKFWFNHLRALATHTSTDTALELAKAMHRLAQLRFKHGEISQLDAQLAQAELQRSEAAWHVSRAELSSTEAALSRLYPSLGLPKWPVQVEAPLPPELDESDTALRETFLRTNHELSMQRINAQRLQLLAQRLARERMPDPTVGIFTARDRAGSEHVTGLSMSLPFSGDARSYNAQAAQADAQAANDHVQALERSLSASFDATLATYQHKRVAATELLAAAHSQAQAAEKSRIAYTLGEHSMSELLAIARVANDNRLAAELMRLDVIELMTSVRLDLHQMWDFDE